ncbi:MAG: acetyltransferase [Ruminococcus flavefaciens]|nr:acetyltransferase [Ruminococcus flavefaciens]
MEELVIIGASGHGRVIADMAELCGYRRIVFLDDDENIRSCGKYPVVGTAGRLQETAGDAIVAVGNADIRQRIINGIGEARLATLVHPAAVVADGVKLGAGTVVMAGAVINPGTETGIGCIINTASSVDHDCRLGDFVHTAAGSHVAGSVKIGGRTWIGAGATVSNNIIICSGCTIGAGAVVVKDIKEAGTYVGVPAKKMK